MEDLAQEQQKANVKPNFGGKGWLLIIIGLLTFFLNMSITGSMNVSAAVFIGSFGWTQTQIMGAATVGQLVGVVVMFIVGNSIRKRSPRIFALILGCIFGVCFFFVGFVNQLWQYYVLIILSALSVAVWSFLCNVTLVGNWFPRKRGYAMGWVTMGMPLGTGITAMIMGQLMPRIGFRAMYFPFAIAGIVICIIEFCALKDFPQDCGCYPDNDKTLDPEALKKQEEMILEAQKKTMWTPKRVLGTKEFWLILLSIGFMMFASGFMAQVVPSLMSFGMAPTTASNFMLVISLVACAGSFILGMVDTRLGSKPGMIITFVCLMAMGVIAQFNYLGAKLVAFIFLGIVMGAGSNFMISIIMHYWGQRNSLNVYRICQPLSSALSAVSATIISFIATNFGGYNSSFLFVVILAVIGLILTLCIRDGFIEKKEAKFIEQDAKKTGGEAA